MLGEILTLMFTWPSGIPGMFCAAQRGLRTTENDWLGTMLVTMYGPSPGGGEVGSTFIGKPAGINPSDGNASTLSNGPYGAVRWIVIFPVASLVVIPEMVFALPAAYCAAPAMTGVMKEPEPPHGIFTARSTV